LVLTLVQTAPGPGALDEARTQGIALDVAVDTLQVLVGLDHEGLEMTLVGIPGVGSLYGLIGSEKTPDPVFFD
jgi:hypothetical protein